MEDSYYNKYLKYKNKYLTLKELLGGEKKRRLRRREQQDKQEQQQEQSQEESIIRDLINKDFNSVNRKTLYEKYNNNVSGEEEMFELEYIQNKLFKYFFDYINTDTLEYIYQLITENNLETFDLTDPNYDIDIHYNSTTFYDENKNSDSIRNFGIIINNYNNSKNEFIDENQFINSIIFMTTDKRSDNGHYMYIDNNLNIYDSFLTEHYLPKDDSGFCHMTALYYSLIYYEDEIKNTEIKNFISRTEDFFKDCNKQHNNKDDENYNPNNKIKPIINTIIINLFLLLILEQYTQEIHNYMTTKFNIPQRIIRNFDPNNVAGVYLINTIKEWIVEKINKLESIGVDVINL